MSAPGQWRRQVGKFATCAALRTHAAIGPSTAGCPLTVVVDRQPAPHSWMDAWMGFIHSGNEGEVEGGVMKGWCHPPTLRLAVD